jgi:hypothetical protein
MLLSDSASLCSQSSLADNSFLPSALLRFAFLRADSTFLPQITQQNRFCLFLVPHNISAFARMQLVLAELLHDLACWHSPPPCQSYCWFPYRGACCSASNCCAVGQDSRLTGGIFQDGPHVAQSTTAQVVTVSPCQEHQDPLQFHSIGFCKHQPSTAKSADRATARVRDVDCSAQVNSASPIPCLS